MSPPPQGITRPSAGAAGEEATLASGPQTQVPVPKFTMEDVMQSRRSHLEAVHFFIAEKIQADV